MTPLRLLSVSLPAALFLVAAPAIRAQELSGQLASIQRQQTSVFRQLASVETQSAAVQRQSADRQRQSVARQLQSAKPQEAILPVWKTVLLEPVSVLQPAGFECPPLAAHQVDNLVHSAAADHDLPPELLRAVMKQESGFHPCAVSAAGAQGLMQLMPDTAAEMNVTDPFDPRQNVFGGAAYLRQLVDRYGGNLKLALSAYNAGMRRVDAIGNVPEISETQNYVRTVMDGFGSGVQAPITSTEEYEKVSVDQTASPAHVSLPLDQIKLTDLSFIPRQ